MVRLRRQSRVDERQAPACDDSRHVAVRRHADDVSPGGVFGDAEHAGCFGHVGVIYDTASPTNVTETSRRWTPSNSTRKTRCQRPKSSPPSATDTHSEARSI